jgi:glycosyltransferase involved in cell wall biosynthesis
MESIGWKNAFFSMHHPSNVSSEWSEYFVNEIQYGHEYSIAQKIAMASKVVYSFEAQKKISQIVERFQPTIAHTHCIYHHLSPSILSVLKERKIPIVMTAHELKANCPAATMRNNGGVCERCKNGSAINVLLHRCIKDSWAPSALVAIETVVHRWLDSYKSNISKVIAPSRFYLEKYVEWGWPRDKMVYIPNYVDAGKLKPEYEPGTYFLYFGRLSVEKGIPTLIRAASVAKVPLKIVGTGPDEVTLKVLANSLGVEIDFLGYRSGDELHAIVRAAKAVVLPSEWYENAPLSVLESYALGKPVIGARIGGIPELVLEGETGWTFASGDVADLTQVLAQTNLRSTAELINMGRAARDFVAARHTKARYLEQVLSVYGSLGVVTC